VDVRSDACAGGRDVGGRDGQGFIHRGTPARSAASRPAERPRRRRSGPLPRWRGRSGVDAREKGLVALPWLAVDGGPGVDDAEREGHRQHVAVPGGQEPRPRGRASDRNDRRIERCGQEREAALRLPRRTRGPSVVRSAAGRLPDGRDHLRQRLAAPRDDEPRATLNPRKGGTRDDLAVAALRRHRHVAAPGL